MPTDQPSPQPVPATVGAGNVAANTGNVAVGSNITQNYYAAPPPGKLFVGVPALPAHKVVGRDDLVAQLRQRLITSGSTAVTALDGKPGVGKTTLATLLAYNVELLDHFTDGILWAGLGPAPDLDGILGAWGDALGCDVRDLLERGDKVQRLQAAIGQRRLLIILDDVWQADAADLLHRITTPRCAYLLTTRDQSIAEEFAADPLPIDELSEQEAVDLLVNLCPRAAAQRDGLARIARIVGFLPLALTLVGGYLRERITFPHQAAAALDAAEQDWLTLTDRRHPLSLKQVIGLSVAALPDDAHRAAFVALAAFAPKPASFSLDAAKAVCECKDDQTIATLIQRNLLEQQPDNPERLTLHQTLAATASHRAADPAAAPVRHARHYLELMDADSDDWQTIEPEWEQIQHAWQWVSADPTGEALVLHYISVAQTFQLMRGYWRDEIAWIERGIELARKSGNRETEATHLSDLGWMYSSLGDQQHALDYFQQALPIMRQVGNRSGEAATLNNIGSVYKTLGDQQQALDYYQQALPIWIQVGDHSGEAVTLNNIGVVYRSLGEPQQALGYYQQALPIRRQVGDHSGEATTLNNIGAVYYALGDKQQALDYYQQALPIQRQVGDRSGEATTLSNIGMVYSALGDQQQALTYYQQALPILQQVGNRSGEGITLNSIGYYYLNAGDLPQACSYLEQALDLAEQVQYPDLINAARNGLESVRRKLAEG